MTEDELRKLTSDLEVLADWKDDLDYRLRRAELIFQTSVGLLDEHRDILLREGRAWKRAANAIVKRVRDE
jgi:hypothetical protein